MVPSDRVPALLKWTHESRGHVGADRNLRLFKQWFHTTWTDDQLRKTLQPIVDKCPCRSCKPGDIAHQCQNRRCQMPQRQILSNAMRIRIVSYEEQYKDSCRIHSHHYHSGRRREAGGGAAMGLNRPTHQRASTTAAAKVSICN